MTQAFLGGSGSRRRVQRAAPKGSDPTLAGLSARHRSARLHPAPTSFSHRQLSQHRQAGLINPLPSSLRVDFFHLSSEDHYVLMVNYPVAVCDTLVRGCVSVSMTRSRATWQHAGASPGWRVPSHLLAKARAPWSFPSEPPFPFPTSTSTCKALLWSSLVARGPPEFEVC